jgi:hypothetical protein
MLFTTTKTKVNGKLAPLQSIGAYGGGGRSMVPLILNHDTNAGKWSASRPGLLTTPGGRALLLAEWETGWGPRAGLEVFEVISPAGYLNTNPQSLPSHLGPSLPKQTNLVSSRRVAHET